MAFDYLVAREKEGLTPGQIIVMTRASDNGGLVAYLQVPIPASSPAELAAARMVLRLRQVPTDGISPALRKALKEESSALLAKIKGPRLTLVNNGMTLRRT